MIATVLSVVAALIFVIVSVAALIVFRHEKKKSKGSPHTQAKLAPVYVTGQKPQQEAPKMYQSAKDPVILSQPQAQKTEAAQTYDIAKNVSFVAYEDDEESDIADIDGSVQTKDQFFDLDDQMETNLDNAYGTGEWQLEAYEIGGSKMGHINDVWGKLQNTPANKNIEIKVHISTNTQEAGTHDWRYDGL